MRSLVLLFVAVLTAASAAPAREAAVDFRAIPLQDALDFVRDVSGRPFFVDWAELERTGVTRDTPVDVQLPDATPARVIRVILRSAARDEPLTAYASDGVIYITSERAADAVLFTRVYDVRDLLVVVPDFTPFGQAQQRDDRTVEERGEELVDLIRTTVRPEVWRENGGNSQIRYFQGQLVITAPRGVHARI